jgi:riboflavin kinase
LSPITLEGKVFTGEGNGKKYVGLPWVKQQIKKKLGYTPFLGTLNLKLTKESETSKKLLKKTQATTILPAKGYCVGLFFKASIEGVECTIVAPQIENYPENVLEIIAPVNLRDKLRLKDGDTVRVSVVA